jgi:hypothetical protein
MVGNGINTLFVNEDDKVTILPGGHTTVHRRHRHDHDRD